MFCNLIFIITTTTTKCLKLPQNVWPLYVEMTTPPSRVIICLYLFPLFLFPPLEKLKKIFFFLSFSRKNTFYLIWKCNTSQQQQLRFSLGESHCKKLNMLQLRKSTFTETVSNWFFFAVVVVMANVLFIENKPKTKIHRNKDKTFFIVDVYPSKN